MIWLGLFCYGKQILTKNFSFPNILQAPSIPNIAYKPSADCAYTMLISKIKGQTAPKVETPPPPPEPVQVIPTQPAETPM